MFGKKSKPITPAAVTVGILAADALSGDLSMDLGTGMKLVTTFSAYHVERNTDQAVSAFVTKLMERDPALAGRLCDALAQAVGR